MNYKGRCSSESKSPPQAANGNTNVELLGFSLIFGSRPPIGGVPPRPSKVDAKNPRKSPNYLCRCSFL
eukprot:9331224-Pyramimonas_sp.AAC.1